MGRPLCHEIPANCVRVSVASSLSKKAIPTSFALFSMTAATLLGDEPPTSDACSSDCSTSSSKDCLTCLLPLMEQTQEGLRKSASLCAKPLHIHSLRLPCSPVWPQGVLAIRDLHAAVRAAVPTAQQRP